jgi:Fe-S oxidoreductase
MWLIRAWMNGEIQTSPHFTEILYSCAACDNCKEQCVFPRFKDFLPEIFQETKAELVSEGLIPPQVRDYFKAISVNGNPYKLPQNERGQWAAGLGIEEYAGQDFLFYIGCVGSYDEKGQKMARSVGSLLLQAGFSLGILGSEEHCDGNEVRILGETGLFTALAEENIIQFKKMDVKKIITLDPHALNTFRKDYPRFRGNFEVFHFSEILADWIRKEKPALGKLQARVTYHDPCYLGRHNQIYDAPREVLQAIPGLELMEMHRNRKNAFCCGGGGGNFFTDILGPGENSPARVRVREALDTGAQILAVACPQCYKMLDDALKAENLEDKIEVLDLAEVIRRAGVQ